MKKVRDYYEILSIDKNAKKKEIEQKVAERSKYSPLTKIEREAAGVLLDPVSRTRYDEELKAYNKSVEKRNAVIKKYHIKGLCSVLGGAALIGTITGVALSNKGNCYGNDYENQPKATSTPTPGPTATPRPTTTPKPTATPLPTPTPIVAENVKVLDSTNINEVAKQLAEEYAKKGFVANVNDLESALLVANMEWMEQDEVKKILAGTNITKKLEGANNFLMALDTHNLNKAVYGNDASKYAPILPLVYNDKYEEGIEAIEGYTVWLLKSMVDGTLTEKKCKASFTEVGNFYQPEEPGLVIDGKKYKISQLPAGYQFLAEMALYPTLETIYVMSGHIDTEQIIDLKESVNGVRYMSDILSYGDEVCSKVNVKKQ